MIPFRLVTGEMMLINVGQILYVTASLTTGCDFHLTDGTVLNIAGTLAQNRTRLTATPGDLTNAA